MMPEDVLQSINQNNTRWVQLQFPDLRGTLKKKVLRASKLSTSNFVKGVEAEEIISIFNEIYEEPLTLMPIADTYAKIPWADSADRLLCTIKKNKERYLKDPMYTLERALNSSEIAKKLSIKQRVHFLITDGTSFSREEGRRSVDTPSKEAEWNPLALRGKDTLPFASEPYDVYSSIRQQIADVMADYFNYSVYSHSHGNSASQQIITFDEQDVMQSAHCLATLKIAAKSVAIANISLATFMPMPNNETANDYEISFSAFEKGVNTFYDPNDKDKLSQTARYFIGGIIEHLEALTFFTNATINSFKRLSAFQKFTSAGFHDRFNAIIIKDVEEFNIKLTFPDPAVNPYLALAVIIAAGLDGINKKTEVEILHESPIALSESVKKKAKIRELPRSFHESLSALESDNEFLKGILSTDLAYAFTELRINDYKDYEQHVSDTDYFNYFHL